MKNVDGYGADDTPKAFARLMAFKTTGKRRSALDDGAPKPKKQKQQQRKAAEEAEQEATSNSEIQPHAELKIMPGEKLSEFRQRVNAALPLTSISRNTKKFAGLSDHRVTKHERRLKKLQEGWRKEEARLREKEQEERELAEEEDDEINDLWEDRTADVSTITGNKGKKKKGKRKLVVGEVDDGRIDEWEDLKKRRQERKGLHDVVQAPPTFERVPREIFKVKEGARVNVGNVPNAVGSLRKREELGVERQGIIETYRQLMAAKREG